MLTKKNFVYIKITLPSINWLRISLPIAVINLILNDIIDLLSFLKWIFRLRKLENYINYLYGGLEALKEFRACEESEILDLSLGKENIRVNAVSAGPIKTLSAKGIKDFSSILNVVEQKAPLHRNVTTVQVGNVATFLLSSMSEAVTGQVIYADNGYNIMGV